MVALHPPPHHGRGGTVEWGMVGGQSVVVDVPVFVGQIIEVAGEAKGVKVELDDSADGVLGDGSA